MPRSAVLLVVLLSIMVDTVLLYNGFDDVFTVEGAKKYFLGKILQLYAIWGLVCLLSSLLVPLTSIYTSCAPRPQRGSPPPSNFRSPASNFQPHTSPPCNFRVHVFVGGLHIYLRCGASVEGSHQWPLRSTQHQDGEPAAKGHASCHASRAPIANHKQHGRRKR